MAHMYDINTLDAQVDPETGPTGEVSDVAEDWVDSFPDDAGGGGTPNEFVDVLLAWFGRRD